MRAIWAVCAFAAGLTILAAAQSAQFPVSVIITAVLTMALTWL